MKATALIRALAVTAVLASACGSTPAGALPPSPSASPASTPMPTPVPPQPGLCQAPTNPCLALVTLRGSSAFVVRDLTDISHPKTLSNLGEISSPKFVSATTLSYVDDKSGLLRTPLSGSPRTRVAAGGGFFTWSPDGTTAAYMFSPPSNGAATTMQLHLVSGGKDRAVGSMRGLPSVFGCESQLCGDGWDFHLSYSPDGRFITWAQNITDVFRMWTANGVDVTPKTPFIQKTIWSGSDFYFQDSKGIEVLRNGVISTFLPGVSWIRPKASPGGGQIVYETRDSAGVARTDVVDTATARVRGLGAWRAEPAFLTARFIWDEGERPCAPDECVSGSAIGSGHTFIYDLQTGTETESIITSVSDVWPHAA